jgi:hypothetical protein
MGDHVILFIAIEPIAKVQDCHSYAEAGIQSFQELLDHRFRGGDTFY